MDRSVAHSVLSASNEKNKLERNLEIKRILEHSIQWVTSLEVGESDDYHREQTFIFVIFSFFLTLETTQV